MACSCGQKSVQPTGMQAAREAADRAAKIAAARADNPSVSRIGPPRTAATSTSGQAQTFALEVPGQGRVLYGSALERDAAAARLARR